MEVSFSDTFKKAFKKKIKDSSTQAIFWNKLELFINEPFDSQLKNTQVIGEAKRIVEFFN